MALTTTSNYDVQVVYRTPDGELWNNEKAALAHLPKALAGMTKAAVLEMALKIESGCPTDEWLRVFIDRLLDAYDLQRKPEAVKSKS